MSIRQRMLTLKIFRFDMKPQKPTEEKCRYCKKQTAQIHGLCEECCPCCEKPQKIEEIEFGDLAIGLNPGGRISDLANKLNELIKAHNKNL